MPKIPNDKNHTSVIGPKLTYKRRTVLLHQNSVTIMAIAIGIMNGSNTSVAIDNPSTADNTEMAGVIIPSPKNSDAPIKPIAIM